MAKIILQFKDLLNLISNIEIYDKGKIEEKFALIDAFKMNKENQEDSYILIEKLDKQQIMARKHNSWQYLKLSCGLWILLPHY